MQNKSFCPHSVNSSVKRNVEKSNDQDIFDEKFDIEKFIARVLKEKSERQVITMIM